MTLFSSALARIAKAPSEGSRGVGTAAAAKLVLRLLILLLLLAMVVELAPPVSRLWWSVASFSRRVSRFVVGERNSSARAWERVGGGPPTATEAAELVLPSLPVPS